MTAIKLRKCTRMNLMLPSRRISTLLIFPFSISRSVKSFKRYCVPLAVKQLALSYTWPIVNRSGRPAVSYCTSQRSLRSNKFVSFITPSVVRPGKASLLSPPRSTSRHFLLHKLETQTHFPLYYSQPAMKPLTELKYSDK